jgi:hypothetical protein
MFAFYTTTSIGLRWVEDSTVALFLNEQGTDPLPWIYILSAAIGIVLVSVYSLLQRILPLRSVVVAIAPCMVVPLVALIVLRWHVSYLAIIAIFVIRLWVDGIYVINDLNTSITANQLFNIREIKRAYPIISSGILIADVISGFSLPLLVEFVKLDQVILVGSLLIVIGSVILWYLTLSYPQAFPEVRQKFIQEAEPRKRRILSGSLRRYALLLFAFFGLLQVIGVFIDFQYLSQLRINFKDTEIAKFLGIFSGTAGLCELAMQWFATSRVLERWGVFITIGILPVLVTILLPIVPPLLGVFPTTEAKSLFWGLVILKFFDDLLRYTFVASGGPLLFQPIPEKIRNHIQTLSGGIAEQIAGLTTGLAILLTIWLTSFFELVHLQYWVLIIETVAIAIICLGLIWLLRSQYVNLLVLSAGRGQLNGAYVDLRTFKLAVVKALGEKSTEADKHSCIELLSQIDPQGATEVLAPLLTKLPPSLQSQSLQVMLNCGANPAFTPYVNVLLEQISETSSPEIFALALRYIWFAQTNPDLRELEEYLHPRHNSLIRATAAALVLRQGTPTQKSVATNTLRRMLTHKIEQERIHGVKALQEVVYLQALRIYIPNLLRDDSLGVRCAVLEMIAATQLEDYYPALIKGLHYKSTRITAMGALVKLENEALPMLLKVATNLHKPEVVRMYAWRTIGQIPTIEAVEKLWWYLDKSQGTTRDHILRTLLKRHQKEGIDSFTDRLIEGKVETYIKEELQLLGEIYAAYVDFQEQTETYATYIGFKSQDIPRNHHSVYNILDICELLQRALLELEIDIKERILLLLKLLYPVDKIQAAAFNLRSASPKNFARGLEILEYTVDLQCKSVLLDTLDKRSPEEKLQSLVEAEVVQYQQMILSDRARSLLRIGNLLSDWCLTCCFYFAQVARIRLTIPQILEALHHPTGLVREAAIAYLYVASHRVLLEVLPQLKDDPHPLIAAQVKELIAKYQD